MQFHLSGFEDRSDMGEAGRKAFFHRRETRPGPPLGLDWMLVQHELQITEFVQEN